MAGLGLLLVQGDRVALEQIVHVQLVSVVVFRLHPQHVVVGLKSCYFTHCLLAIVCITVSAAVLDLLSSFGLQSLRFLLRREKLNFFHKVVFLFSNVFGYVLHGVFGLVEGKVEFLFGRLLHLVDRCLGIILDFEILFVQLSQFGRKRFKPLKILFIVYRSIVYLVLEAHLE